MLFSLESNAIAAYQWQEISSTVVVLAGFITAVVALLQWNTALKQQRDERRWKQAELARRLTDEWFDWKPSGIAMMLIDEGKGVYKLGDGPQYDINGSEDIPNALRLVVVGNEITEESHEPKDVFVRRCFDNLFYYFERAGHSIKIGVALGEDFDPHALYYVRRLALYQDVVEKYLKWLGYENALAFLRRHNAWK